MEVSIIIPVYNKAKYLHTILEQIQNQSFSNYQCIIVDDGSTDGSEKICSQFAENDERFIVFHIKKGGVSHARNIGIQHAKGKYITFIDADDEIHPDYIGNLYSKLIENSADMIIGTSVKIWDNSEKREIIEVPYNGLINSKQFLSEFAKNQYYNGIYGYCWGKMISSQFIKEKKFNENIHLAEDLDFYLSVYPYVKNIYFDVSPYCYYYRQEAVNSSMLQEDWEIDYYSQLLIQLKIYTMLKSLNQLNCINETLITKRIYDYVFFTLFHAPQDEIRNYCKQIRALEVPSIKNLKEYSWKQRCVLFMFNNRMDFELDKLMKLYRKLRRL